MYLEVAVIEQNPETGQLLQINMNVNSLQVAAILSMPLQPKVICLEGLPPLITQTPLPEEIDGLHKFDTQEAGGTAYINPSKVIFYFTTEIGSYTLVFAGGHQIAVKETGANLKRVLEGAPGIELDI